MPRPSGVTLGCLWIGIFIGNQWALLTLDAATITLIAWLEEPALIALLHHHRRGQGVKLLLDWDEGSLECLFPRTGERIESPIKGYRLFKREGEFLLEDEGGEEWALSFLTGETTALNYPVWI